MQIFSEKNSDWFSREFLYIVFSYLRAEDLACAALICKCWNKAFKKCAWKNTYTIEGEVTCLIKKSSEIMIIGRVNGQVDAVDVAVKTRLMSLSYFNKLWNVSSGKLA